MRDDEGIQALPRHRLGLELGEVLQLLAVPSLMSKINLVPH